MIWRIALLEARVGELAAAIIRRRLLAFIVSTPTRGIRSSPPDAPAPSEPKPLATSVTGGSGGRGLRCRGAPAVCACASSVTRTGEMKALAGGHYGSAVTLFPH